MGRPGRLSKPCFLGGVDDIRALKASGDRASGDGASRDGASGDGGSSGVVFAYTRAGDVVTGSGGEA